jgi:ATP-binding cassette, subfamily B, bacterial MsbA
VAVGLVLGTRAVAAEPQFASRLLSFVASALLLYQPLKAIAQTAGQSTAGLTAATRLFAFLERPIGSGGTLQLEPLRHSVQFHQVSFAYADGRPVLDNVTFSLTRGEVVAVVGPSGSGKSTLLSLALGFLRPSNGHISWDDVNLEQVNIESRRRHLGWVPQEPVLLSGTVFDNVTLGSDHADEAAVWTALEQANASAFVRALPAALQTNIGERGSQLSGGQKQRLAVARALLRRPSLLVLDEPTSALDVANEDALTLALAHQQATCATLLVAHRLSTVERADHILFLEHGRIVERGSHRELVSQGGRYAAWVNEKRTGRRA